jgi:NAD/NADP transhydrogenase alpha subunit
MIGKMRNLLTINQYTYGQDEFGGVTKTIQRSFQVYGSFSDLNYMTAGGQVTENQAQQWSYDYRAKVRYDAGQAIKERDEVVYNGKVLAINRIQRQDEGKQRYVTLYMTTLDG